MEPGVDAEILELPAPVGVGIAQALDIDAAWYSPLDSCLDELRSKKRTKLASAGQPEGGTTLPNGSPRHYSMRADRNTNLAALIEAGEHALAQPQQSRRRSKRKGTDTPPDWQAAAWVISGHATFREP